MSTPNEIDQQRRVINDTRSDVAQLLSLLSSLQMRAQTYTRLGYGDDQFLADDAFEGTGTDKVSYRSAITTLGNIDALLTAGNGKNLETFAR